MGDSKAKIKNTPTKQDVKTSKSPAKSKNTTPCKTETKKTSVKSSSTTPVKSTEKKMTPVKESMKESNVEKKTPIKENVLKKAPVKESSPTKNTSISKETSEGPGAKRGKREGLPFSRVRTIMKTARYAEGISPDAVQLTVIAAELFIKYLIKGVYKNATAAKKKKIDYSCLAKYVNSDDEEHLEFLRVLIPHKISVGEYKKLISESSKNSDKLDFLVSESEESDSESDEDASEEESEEEEEEDDDEAGEDSDIQEIPTPEKTTASPKKVMKKSGKVETVDLGSSSEDDFIIVDQKKKVGPSSKGVTVL